MNEMDQADSFDPTTTLGAILIWITQTTRASRLARLSTIGLQMPRYREPDKGRWREDLWQREG